MKRTLRVLERDRRAIGDHDRIPCDARGRITSRA
jgi:hypothetical protein